MAANPISRTRTGCWRCRERRIKCDETRPVCRRCARNHGTCGYGIRLVWNEESIARGVCHGRAGVWSKQPQTSRKDQGWLPKSKKNDCVRTELQSIFHVDDAVRRVDQSWLFLNTTINDLRLYFDHHGEKEDYDTGTEWNERTNQQDLLSDNDSWNPGQLVLHRSLSTIPIVTRTFSYDPALFSYFENIICSSSTLVDDSRYNPYRYLILPMALQSEGIYHATLAISASTLRLSESKYSITALEHHNLALKRLMQLLNQVSWTDMELDEMLGLVLMLCWFEISDNSRPSWVVHLNGFRDLIRKCQHISHLSTYSQELYRFFNRYFAFHLVLARTAFRVDNQIRTLDSQQRNEKSSQRGQETFVDMSLIVPKISNSTTSLSLDMNLDSLDIIDPYMGFSNSLLLLINEVADLAWEEGDSVSDELTEPLDMRVTRLKESLENLRQIPPFVRSTAGGKENSGSSGEIAETECQAIAEANRLGALVLLHEICSSTNTSSDHTINSVTYNTRLLYLRSEDKDQHVRGILNLILDNQKNMMRTAALPLWPLFLAGCCAPGEEERITVLRLFEELEGIKRFGNIAPARKVVEMVWRQRDLALQDDRKWQMALNKVQCNPINVAKGRACGARFEWERAMTLLGGWKLSLT